MSWFVALEEVFTTSCVVVSILVADVVVTCSIVVFECELFWPRPSATISDVCGCVSVEPVVVVVDWGNVAAVERCFEVTLTVEKLVVSSPKNGGEDTFVTWCKDADLSSPYCREAFALIYLISHLLLRQSEVSPV